MIAVIGSTNIDIVYEVDHFTNPGETQTALSLNYYFGGKGANQAVAVAKISGNKTLFSTSVGGDREGEDVVRNFQDLKIEGYKIHQNKKTGRAFIEVDKSGENRIVITPGTNQLHTPVIVEEFLETYGQQFNYCLIQNEIPADTIKEALTIMEKENIEIIYDPAPKEKTNIEWLKGIDFLTPNETEFKYLKNKLKIKADTLEKEALKFKGKAEIKNLIIKRGNKELIIVDNKDKIIRVKPFKVKAVDTTAAGDIFNAGLAVALSKDLSIKEAARYGSAAAAVSVTKKGAQSSIPNKKEITEMLADN